MHIYQTHKETLEQYIQQYFATRQILFKSYQRYIDDSDTQRYGAREIALSLYSLIEVAQSCYEAFTEMLQDKRLNQQERLLLQITFSQLTHQCHIDHIDYQPAKSAIPVTLNYQSGDSHSDTDKAIEQLHLLQHVLNGVAKMGYSLYGDFVKIIIDKHGYAATMNFKDELKIDIDKLLTHPQLITHIIIHEIGHADDHAFGKLTTQQEQVTTLTHALPSFVQQMDSERDKNEALADFYATFGSVVFNVPLEFVLSRANHLSQLTPPNIHGPQTFDYPFRAEMMQKVYSTLQQHFHPNKFGQNNRWYRFARHLQQKAKITFHDLPSFEAIEEIYQQFPGNPYRQIQYLKYAYPALFAPTYDGQFPPPIQVSANIDEKLLGQENQLSLKEIGFNEQLSPSKYIGVESFQQQWQDSSDISYLSRPPHALYRRAHLLPNHQPSEFQMKPYELLNNQSMNTTFMSTAATQLMLYKVLSKAAGTLFNSTCQQWQLLISGKKSNTQRAHSKKKLTSI